jgi:integrase
MGMGMDNQSGERGATNSKSRTRYQQGSLTREGNRWFGRWREDVLLTDGTIKRLRRKQVLGTIEELPTKKLAQRELARRLEPVNHEDYRPTSTVTFGLFAKKWMKEIMLHHKPSSQSSERSVINVQLLPFFGEHQLRNINLEMIQRFVNTSVKSSKTIRNAIGTLTSMWNTAQAWEYVQHNPFPRGASGRLLLKLPAVRPAQTYHFTVEEALAIIDKAQGRWKTFFRVLAETGMRPGELAGLRRDAIGDRALTISQSVWGQRVQTPKSLAGIRSFAISGSLAEDLRLLIDSTADNDYGLVFVTNPGRGKRNRHRQEAGTNGHHTLWELRIWAHERDPHGYPQYAHEDAAEAAGSCPDRDHAQALYARRRRG